MLRYLDYVITLWHARKTESTRRVAGRGTDLPTAAAAQLDLGSSQNGDSWIGRGSHDLCPAIQRASGMFNVDVNPG
jgi:hypothetical protein